MMIKKIILTLTIMAVIPFSQFALAADNKSVFMDIINDIKFGWENGDGTPFRKHFLDYQGARYIESGGQNEGLDDLVLHHVEPEKDAFEYLILNFSDVEVNLEDDFAWVVATTEVKGKVKRSGKVIDKTGYQTFIFKKVQDSWKVIHTHSSTRNRKTKKTKH